MFMRSATLVNLYPSRYLHRLKDMTWTDISFSGPATVNQVSCPKIKSDVYVQATHSRNLAPHYLHGGNQDICIPCSKTNETNIPICWLNLVT